MKLVSAPRPGHLARHILPLLAAVLMTGCGVKDSLDQTATTIQGIGADLANGAADFNGVASRLTDVIQGLPRETATELRMAMEQTAQRSLQAAGIEARCSADFARQRIGQDLEYLAQRLRAAAHNRPAPTQPPADPVVCQPSPPSIRKDRIPVNGIVQWDGYDLTPVGTGAGSLTLSMERQNGTKTPVPILGQSSPYLLVADVSRIREQLDPTVTKLVLMWGDKRLSEVAVELPPQPVRKTIDAELSPWGPKLAGHCKSPRKVDADGEFRGHGPKVDWSVSLSVSPDRARLLAHIRYRAMEWDEGGRKAKSDFTEACGDWDEVVYSATPGQRILRLVDAASDTGSYVDTTHADENASGKLYGRYVLGGDRKGDDVGVSTKIQAPVKGTVKIEVEVTPP